jgi:uncharacterized membrane protein YfcA
MNPTVLAFYAAICAASIAFVLAALRAARHRTDQRRPTLPELGIGFVVAFFDTLGIGSFAPTTAVYKITRLVPDEQIPGTLNVGLTPSALLESVMFVTSILVDPWLLLAMVTSAAAGAWLGAGVVARLPRRIIQAAMGLALIIAGTVFVCMNLDLLPGGGLAMALHGWRFALAVGINFLLGALMSVGIGLYAPCMVTLALLGMHPIAAFPIMMGSCALLQPIASLSFFRSGRFAWGPSWGLVFGGIVGSLVAYFLVKSMELKTLRWLVVVVIGYAAVAMLHSAFGRRRSAATTAAV